MSTPVLEKRALIALATLVDGRERLDEALEEEDEYLRLTQKLISDHGGSAELLKTYSAPEAVSGGRRQCIELLSRLCTDLKSAAERASLKLPAYLAVWWPDREPTAESALGEGGCLIRINLGLLAQVRMFVHLVSSALTTITGDANVWDADRLTVDQARSDFLDMLDEYRGLPRVPLWKTVRALRGPRELFRRQASIAGLAYVLAHELGHLAIDDQEFVRAALIPAGPSIQGGSFSERQAVATFNLEASADAEAVRILLEWNPTEDEEWELARAVGAASVMAIQSAKFWISAAVTDESLDWKHPDPDIRLIAVCMGLANPKEFERIRQANPAATEPIETNNSHRAERFVAWLNEVTGTERFRQIALKRGLTGRGLTPPQLMAIDLAHGKPKEQR